MELKEKSTRDEEGAFQFIKTAFGGSAEQVATISRDIFIQLVDFTRVSNQKT